MFKVTFGKGFHLVFENGVTLSTQFGYGNYCTNKNTRDMQGILSCENAEIAIFDKNESWLTKECLIDLNIENDGDVLGYVDMDKWLKILDWCRNYK